MTHAAYATYACCMPAPARGLQQAQQQVTCTIAEHTTTCGAANVPAPHPCIRHRVTDVVYAACPFHPNLHALHMLPRAVPGPLECPDAPNLCALHASTVHAHPTGKQLWHKDSHTCWETTGWQKSNWLAGKLAALRARLHSIMCSRKVPTEVSNRSQ